MNWDEKFSSAGTSWHLPSWSYFKICATAPCANLLAIAPRTLWRIQLRMCSLYCIYNIYCTMYSTIILYRREKQYFLDQKKTELARYEEFFFHNKLWYMWYYTVYTWGILQNRSRISHPAIVNNIRNCVLYGTHCKNNKQIYLKIGVCNGS